MNIAWLIVLIVVIIALGGIVFLAWGLKKAFKLVLNSLIGFFALWLTQQVLVPTLLINIWSVLLTAVFGIIGYVLVIILHFLRIAF